MAIGYLGAIRGDFTVDSNGGASYTIPIQTPPGVKKLEPKLALAYNSGHGNGILGQGWSLGGLSAIARSPQTLAQDGQRGAITYSDSDRFTLDGQRLMLASGSSYSSQNAIYHTEIESWQQVVPQYSGTPGRSGPDSFLVYTHDGKVLEYGTAGQSAVPVSSWNPTIRVWGLNRVTDPNGNYLDIVYDLELANSFSYVTQITYGANKNSAVQAQRSIQFHYAPRTDYFSTYAGGSAITPVQLLDQIQTYLDGKLIRTYTFAFQTGASTGRSQLASVTEADANGAQISNNFVTGGVALPPTTVGWAPQPVQLFSTSPSSVSTGALWQGSMLPMDVDGNGRTDIVNAYSIVNSYNNGVNLALNVFISTGSGYGAPISVSTSVPYYQGMQILPMDVNGDGCADLVVAQGYGSYTAVYILLASVDSNGVFQGFTAQPKQIFDGQNGLPNVPSGANLIPMDVDGDGLTDLVCSFRNGNLLGLQILFSQGTSFVASSTDQTAQSIQKASIQYFQGALYLPMDFSGHTMTDLIYSYHSGSNYAFTLFTSAGRDGLIAQTNSPLASGVNVPVAGVLIPVDINADGIGDLLQVYLHGSNLILQSYVSNGVSLQLGASQTFAVSNVGTGVPLVTVTELNGDGIPDLLVFTQSGTQLQMMALLGTGVGFTPAGSVPSATLPPNGTQLTPAYVSQPGSSIPLGALALPLDMDGDGKTDLAFAYASGNHLSLGLMPATPGWPGLAQTITNGLGGQFQMEYAPLTDPSVYSRNSTVPPDSTEPAGLLNSALTGATFPLSSAPVGPPVTPGSTPTTRIMDFPRYVVANYTKTDGRGGSYPYECSYSQALMDLTGRGWLGFAAMRVVGQYIDPQTGAASVCNTDTLTNYSQPFPLTGRESSMLLRRATDGAWMQSVSHSFDAIPQAQGIQLVVPTTTSALNFNFAAAPAQGAPAPSPDSTAITTLSNYDSYGNPQTMADTGTALGAPLYTLRQYLNDDTNWRIGFLQSETYAADSAGAVVYSKEVRSYDGAMNVVQRQLWNDQTSQLEATSYSYDPVFGNMVSVTDTSGAVTDLTIETNYNTFVQTKTLPPNSANVRLVWQYDYYAQFGLVQNTTEPSGSVWTHVLDGLGRETGTIGPSPGGTQVNLTAIQWGTDATGTYMQESRLVDWNGTMTWTKAYIDGLLRKYTEHLLAPDGVSTLIRDSVLDAQGLAVQQSLPYYRGTAPLYVLRQYDAFQRHTQAIQPSGNTTVTTQWSYTTLSDVQKTVGVGQPNPRVTSSEYRVFRHKRKKISETDTVNGTATFTYDGLGRLTNAVDPGGVSTTTSYDSYGRKVSFQVQGGSMSIGKTFQYNDTQRTITETDANGTVITQSYDAPGRMISRVLQPQSGLSMSAQYSYDDPSVSFGKGKLTGVTMSNGAGYSFGYDSAGNQSAKTVTIGSSYAFERTYNPLRKVLSTTFPDTSVQTNSYNASGQLTAVSLARPGSQQLSASYSGFNAFKRPAALSYGSGAQAKYSYDPSGRLNGHSLYAPGGTLLAGSTYDLSIFNEVSQVTDQISSTSNETFNYDAVGRLVGASGPYGNLIYDYDASGNLTTKDDITFKSSGYQTVSGVANSQPAFAAVYDSNGNLVSATRNNVASSYGFDADNQLVTGNGASMLYDFRGNRIRKVNSATTTDYPSRVFEVQNPGSIGQTSTIYLYAGSDLVAVSYAGQGSTPAVYYNYQNYLKNSLVQTDANGNVAASIVYQPFGKIFSQAASVLSRTYTGKEWDPDLNLYYLGARYYDPFTGKFVSLDNQTGAPFDQRDALNRYCYGGNDPINQFDPTGHSFLDIFAAIARFTMDVWLIANGIAIMATTVLGGPASTVVGSVLLGAGIAGLTTDITTAVNHGSFTSSNSWKNWGINVGIGAAGGLISGGFAAAASGIVSAGASVALQEGASTAWSSFMVGGAARVAVNVIGGVVGNGLSGFTTEVVGNLNPYNPSYDKNASVWKGVGFASLIGGILGGASAGASEGLAAFRSVKVSSPDFGDVQMENLDGRGEVDQIPQSKGDIPMSSPNESTPLVSRAEKIGWTWLPDTTKNNFAFAVTGASFTGFDAFLTAVNWHPDW